MMKVIQFDKSR